MKRFLLWFASGVMLSACDKVNDSVAPSIAPPNLAVTRFYDQDFRGEGSVVLLSCNGDLVPVDYKSAGHLNGQISGGNRAHIEYHATFTGEGIGAPSGLQYRFNESDNQVDNFDAVDFAGETFTILANFHYNARGAAEDFRGHFLYHFTINANGELTALADNFVVECK